MKKIKKKIFFVSLFLINSCAGTSVTSTFGNALFSEKGFYKTIDDSLIYTKIKAGILPLGLNTISDIGIHVYEGTVLLVGNIGSSQQRLEIVKKAWEEDNVKEVINEIEIGANYSIKEKSNDLYLQTKINASLLLATKVVSNNYSIQVYRKNIYVIGLSRSLDEKIEIEEFLQSFDECDKIFNFIEVSR